MTVVQSVGSIFQSTLPLRGVTDAIWYVGLIQLISIHTPLAGSDLRGVRFEACLGISIHTPLAGSDRRPPARASSPRNFNPRSPCGERLAVGHACTAVGEISIHAPLAGNDPCATPRGCGRRDFNPRSPCGERPDATVYGLDDIQFQSTLPLRGTTSAKYEKLTILAIFQSTLPLRGATLTYSSWSFQ